MQSVVFISDWQADIVSASSDMLTLTSSDIDALAAKAPATSLDGSSEATTYFAIPVSLFDAADAYLGMSYITGFGVGAGYAADVLQLNSIAYGPALAGGGKIACRISPKWIEHDAQHRLQRDISLAASGSVTLSSGCLSATVEMAGDGVIELPHSYEFNAGTGEYLPRKIEVVLWAYDASNSQPSITIAGQNAFWIQDYIRWADDVPPAFAVGYQLLQLRLTLLGGASTWLGTWSKHTGF